MLLRSVACKKSSKNRNSKSGGTRKANEFSLKRSRGKEPRRGHHGLAEVEGRVGERGAKGKARTRRMAKAMSEAKEVGT
jgi:hypothetical protein